MSVFGGLAKSASTAFKNPNKQANNIGWAPDKGSYIKNRTYNNDNWSDSVTGKYLGTGQSQKELPLSSAVLAGVAGATGIGALSQPVVDWAKSLYAPYLPPDSMPDTNTPPDNSGAIPSPQSFTPAGFNFNDTNAPFLGLGVMQSSEMIAQSIGSLTQIIQDTHVEHMQVIASKMQNDYDSMSQLNANLTIISTSLLSIVDSLNQFSNSSLEGVGAIAGAVSNIPQTTLQTKDTVTNVNVDTTALNEWALMAKNRENFLQSPFNVIDSDGALVSSAKPMEMEALKNAHAQKHLNDQNTFKVDSDDFNPMSLMDWIPLKFHGRSEFFNPDFNLSNYNNPYSNLFN